MITIPVPIPGRAYEVRIGRFGSADAVRKRWRSSLGRVSGVAVLVDETVGQRSPLVAPLVEALAGRLPNVNVRRYDLPGARHARTSARSSAPRSGWRRRALTAAPPWSGWGAAPLATTPGLPPRFTCAGSRSRCAPPRCCPWWMRQLAARPPLTWAPGRIWWAPSTSPGPWWRSWHFWRPSRARERIAGLAEVVKAGLIADAALLSELETRAEVLATGAIDDGLARVIATAVRIKAEVVTEDEREAGRRAILNFGHTVGHALETASGYQLLHGEAISLGMMAALSLGVALGITAAPLRDRAGALLSRLGLPTDVERRLTAEVLAHIDVDKKRKADAVRFVFVTEAGATRLQELPLTELRQPAAVNLT